MGELVFEDLGYESFSHPDLPPSLPTTPPRKPRVQDSPFLGFVRLYDIYLTWKECNSTIRFCMSPLVWIRNGGAGHGSVRIAFLVFTLGFPCHGGYPIRYIYNPDNNETQLENNCRKVFYSVFPFDNLIFSSHETRASRPPYPSHHFVLCT
jgi:hypothetical protein